MPESCQETPRMLDVTAIIQEKLQRELTPIHLEVKNVSHQHRGHASSPGSGQSHFEVSITAAAFEGLGKVARHRKIYQILASEMAGPIHALALETLAPSESKSPAGDPP